MLVTHQLALRLTAYWSTIFAALWSLAYFFVYETEKGREWYRNDMATPMLSATEIRSSTGSLLISIVSPLLVMTSLSVLAITTTPLPTWRTSWIQKIFAATRNFKMVDAEEGRNIAKKNQFFVGEMNFNYLAFFIIVLPSLAYFLATVDRRLVDPDQELTTKRKVHIIANTCGNCGVLALAFFLVPVTRHSVLLVALGWPPINALRLHVWAGYTSFFFICLHSALCMADLWAFNEEPVWEHVIPGKECWSWNPPEEGLPLSCRKQFMNFTGIFATLWFMILIMTSLNWFRRRWYRLFYVFHVTFGTAMLLTSIAHYNALFIYVLPSIVYYLASTTPTLIQALASRFRGGVKIVKVLSLVDAGGCTEVRVACDAQADAVLQREPCLFVKLCVPKISLVWHPFTVYRHPDDPTTVRFLFRPVGPFTTQLANSMTAIERPITLLDGFYRGGDRCNEALMHDHVTIVAGGIAITPFLSMIPSLLFQLSRAKDPPNTKHIVLHWVCREHGLIRFVEENYLANMARMARLMSSSPDFEFAVHIYQTGKLKTVSEVSEVLEVCDYNYDIESSVFETGTETGSSTMLAADTKNNNAGGCGRGCSGVDQLAPTVLREPNCSKMNDNFSNDRIEFGKEVHTETQANETNGFAMELGRMMPARYHQVWRNLPLFVAISFGIWVSYHLIFDWYQYQEESHNESFGRIRGNFMAVLVSTGFAILVEGAVLRLRQHWPSPRQDSFVVEKTVSGDGVKAVATTSPRVHCEHHTGRPSIEDLMAGARLAEAPGIFMCGPAAMAEVIKKEARKENSVLGLTRYCLYEDPFEM